MAKAKTGDRYVCDECGMVVSVEEPCTCDACGIVCCDLPMVKAPGAARTRSGEPPRRVVPHRVACRVVAEHGDNHHTVLDLKVIART